MLARPRLGAYVRELGRSPVVASYSGEQLIGLRYLPPFPYFMGSDNAFQVLRGDFVTTDDGTGVVHMAPAYGEDDKATTDTVGILPVTPVDPKAGSTPRCPDYQGPACLRRQPADHPRPQERHRVRGGQRSRADPARNL